MTRVLVMLIAVSLVSGCSGTTVSPSPVVLVTIVPGTALLTLGTDATFSAFVARSDGSGATAVSAAWTTDNPAVVSVDAHGLARAITAGVATMTATYQGTSASRSLRVIPSYAGSWSGGYRTTACSASDPSFCMFEHAVGATSGAVAAFLTQVGDQAKGFVVLDGSTIPAAGTVAVTGELVLQGEVNSQGPPPQDVLTRIESWTSSIDQSSQMLVGRFTHLHAEGSSGSGRLLSNRVDSELLNVKPFGAR